MHQLVRLLTRREDFWRPVFQPEEIRREGGGAEWVRHVSVFSESLLGSWEGNPGKSGPLSRGASS